MSHGLLSVCSFLLLLSVCPFSARLSIHRHPSYLLIQLLSYPTTPSPGPASSLHPPALESPSKCHALWLSSLFFPRPAAPICLGNATPVKLTDIQPKDLGFVRSSGRASLASIARKSNTKKREKVQPISRSP